MAELSHELQGIDPARSSHLTSAAWGARPGTVDGRGRRPAERIRGPQHRRGAVDAREGPSHRRDRRRHDGRPTTRAGGVNRVRGAVSWRCRTPTPRGAADLAAAFDGVRGVGDPLDSSPTPRWTPVVIASPGFVHEEQCWPASSTESTPVREAPDHGQRVVAAPGRGRGQARRPTGPGGLHAPLRPRVRADEGHARQRAARPHAAAAQHPPQQEPSGLLPLRDDRARLARPREVDVATVHLRRGDRRESPCWRARRRAWPPRGSSTRRYRCSGWPAGAWSPRRVFVNCRSATRCRCEAVARARHHHGGQDSTGIYSTVADEHGGYWGGQVPRTSGPLRRAYDLEVQAWVDASRRGEVVGPEEMDGYVATAVCTAGMESLATGQPVRVDPRGPHGGAGRGAMMKLTLDP